MSQKSAHSDNLFINVSIRFTPHASLLIHVKGEPLIINEIDFLAAFCPTFKKSDNTNNIDSDFESTAFLPV